MCNNRLTNPLCMHCNCPLFGGQHFRCPKCGSSYDITDANTFNTTGIPINFLDRYILAAPPWPIIIIAIIVIVWRLWLMRDPWIAMQGTWIYGWYFWTGLIIIGLRGIQLLLRPTVKLKYGCSLFIRKMRSKYPAWPFLGALIVSSSWVAERHLQVNLAFYLSEPDLNKLANQAIANSLNINSIAPTKSGMYIIKDIEVYTNKHVFLYTAKGEIGAWGFARLPDIDMKCFNYGEYDNKFISPNHKTIVRRIRGDWYVVYDEYYYYKKAWS